MANYTKTETVQQPWTQDVNQLSDTIMKAFTVMTQMKQVQRQRKTEDLEMLLKYADRFGDPSGKLWPEIQNRIFEHMNDPQGFGDLLGLHQKRMQPQLEGIAGEQATDPLSQKIQKIRQLPDIEKEIALENLKADLKQARELEAAGPKAKAMELGKREAAKEVPIARDQADPEIIKLQRALTDPNITPEQSKVLKKRMEKLITLQSAQGIPSDWDTRWMLAGRAAQRRLNRNPTEEEQAQVMKEMFPSSESFLAEFLRGQGGIPSPVPSGPTPLKPLPVY